MENFINEVLIKEAFLVSKDEIKNVKAFELTKLSNNYNFYASKNTYYLTEKGWIETGSYDKCVFFNKEEAEQNQRKRMEDHLAYLNREQLRMQSEAEKLAEKLKG
jgi:hypothetical protein